MPPGRRSLFDAITVKPFGPHHCFMRSGSVNACHTSSRGASNTRVMTNSELVVAAVAVLVVAALAVVMSLPFESGMEAMSALAPAADLYERRSGYACSY